MQGMKPISKNFPLPRIQCGAVLGNGKIGCLIWGQDNVFHITIGCADLWDHRGGMPICARQNWKDICQALHERNEKKIDDIFRQTQAGSVRQPSLIPVGRISVVMPQSWRLVRYDLILENGVTEIVIQNRQGKEQRIRFCCDMTCRQGLVGKGIPEKSEVCLIPSWNIFRGQDFKKFELCEHNSLEEHGFSPPERWKDGNRQAFLQPFPADSACIAILQHSEDELSFNLMRGTKPLKTYTKVYLGSFSDLLRGSSSWWKNYWNRVPSVALDHDGLEQIYFHGMYKYGIMTNPAGPPPGLQGPWIEDDRLPPWQGDYHFNINVQMCLSPGLRAGLDDHLKRFFEMIFSWREILRRNAENFVGIKDGYMLPHAVDDRCTCMGSFWTGSADHACAAWISQIMFDYCDINTDWDYLRDKVYDFMRGTMRVFQMMLVQKTDGSLELPVSVSPEYRDARINAWGINSSFQLAAIHRLARNLLKAASILKIKPDPFWQEVEEKLPLCSIAGKGPDQEIALWKGLKLRESHRHHSHLGGLVPFDIFDLHDPEWKKIIERSIFHWTKNGLGAWTGWAMPWGSQIRSRLKHAEMAVLTLELWQRCFNNEGGASLHDAWFPGLTFIACERGEIMQIDGAMGSVSAVQDILAHAMNGELHFFYGVPLAWKYAEMTGLKLSGGITASGRFERGKTRYLNLTAGRDAEIHIRTADCPNRLTLTLCRGETAELKPGKDGELVRIR